VSIQLDIYQIQRKGSICTDEFTQPYTAALNLVWSIPLHHSQNERNRRGAVNFNNQLDHQRMCTDDKWNNMFYTVFHAAGNLHCTYGLYYYIYRWFCWQRYDNNDILQGKGHAKCPQYVRLSIFITCSWNSPCLVILIHMFYRYLMSMAIGDLSVILFCVPFTSILYTMNSWPFGEFMCKFSEFIKDVSIGVSVFTLTAMSAERYSAIKHPLRRFQASKVTHNTWVTITGTHKKCWNY